MTNSRVHIELSHHEEYNDGGNLIKGYDKAEKLIFDNQSYDMDQLFEKVRLNGAGKLSPSLAVGAIFIMIENLLERIKAIEEKQIPNAKT